MVKVKGQPPRASGFGAKQRIVTLRVSAEIHTRLMTARERGKSMNQICVELLDKGLPEPAAAETLTSKHATLPPDSHPQVHQ